MIRLVSYDGDLLKLVVRKCNLLHNHHLGHGLPFLSEVEPSRAKGGKFNSLTSAK